MSPRTHCTFHCSRCGRHFHSLESFDLHHTGDYRSNDPEVGRRCLAPWEVVDQRGRERLEPLSEDGICEVYADVQEGVTVWTSTRARESAAKAFRGRK